MNNATQALAGIRVVDCSTVFAGPAAAAYLADFGADVIKVEHPDGDHARAFAPLHDGVSLWWKLVNRNKRAITLDLHGDDGQAAFKQLARESDVVIENFRPGTLERWGLGYDTLAAENERLVMLRVTAFGQEGPYSNRPGFGTLAEAMSGLAYLVGYPDRPPLLPPLALGDNIGAIAGAFAVALALFERTRTQLGQSIDLALIDPLLAVLGMQTLVRSVTGEVMQRQGNRVQHLAPRGAWETNDGRWISVTVGNESTFRRLATAMGRPELVRDARFVDNESRLANVDAIEAVLAEWFGQRSFDEALAALEAENVSCAPLYDVTQLQADPQFLARGSFVRLDDDELGPIVLPNVLARFSRTPGEVRFAGRAKGADNESIQEEYPGLRCRTPS